MSFVSLRQAARIAPRGVRFATTAGAPGHVKTTTRAPLLKRMTAHLPVEAYPLVFFCCAMPTYMCLSAYWTLERGRKIGDLRVYPTGYDGAARKEVWED